MTYLDPVPQVESSLPGDYCMGSPQFAIDESTPDPARAAAGEDRHKSLDVSMSPHPSGAGGTGMGKAKCPNEKHGDCIDAQRVADAIRQQLIASPYRELHQLQLRIDAGRVELHGTTTTFYLKQMAQEIARRTNPTLRVINQVQVVRCSPGPHKPR